MTWKPCPHTVDGEYKLPSDLIPLSISFKGDIGSKQQRFFSKGVASILEGITRIFLVKIFHSAALLRGFSLV